MKKILYICSCFLLILNGISAQNEPYDLPLTDIKGAEVNLKEYVQQNDFTLVTFWATWCSPCKREMDALSDLYEDWKEDFGLEVVAISVDDARSAAQVNATVKKKDWPFVILKDVDQSSYQKMNFNSIPFSILIDKNGKEIYRHLGYNVGDEYELEEILEKASEK